MKSFIAVNLTLAIPPLTPSELGHDKPNFAG